MGLITTILVAIAFFLLGVILMAVFGSALFNLAGSTAKKIPIVGEGLKDIVLGVKNFTHDCRVFTVIDENQTIVAEINTCEAS